MSTRGSLAGGTAERRGNVWYWGCFYEQFSPFITKLKAVPLCLDQNLLGVRTVTDSVYDGCAHP